MRPRIEYSCRNRPRPPDDFKRVTSQRRIRRSRPRRRRLPGIALAHQRIEIRKHGRGEQERIVLVNQRSLIRGLIAQCADHEFRRFLRPRIRVGMLPHRQLLIRANPSSYESGQQKRRPHRIHKTKSRRLKKHPRIVKRAHWLAIEAPLVRARLMKFCVGHDFD